MPVLKQKHATELVTVLRARLNRAKGQGLMDVSLQDIQTHVRVVDAPATLADKALPVVARGISGGVKDFKRRPESAILKRADKAWLHFTLTVGEQAGTPLLLLAYDFELVYSGGHVPAFVRFDLNGSGHANQARELRSTFTQGTRTSFSLRRFLIRLKR